MTERKKPDNRKRAEMSKVVQELRQGEKKVPRWPKDVIHQVAVMAEESGEAVKAALDYFHGRGHLEELKIELRQTAAICLRTLVALGEEPSIRPRLDDDVVF